MNKISTLYITGSMLWGIWDTERVYRALHFRPLTSGMVNFDVSQGLWMIFALPGTLAIHALHWSPTSPMVTLASAAFWLAAWMLRKRLGSWASPPPASAAMMRSAPPEMIAWDRNARAYYEEDWP